MSEPLAYTPAGAAEATGLGRTTIYKLMNDGLLDSFHVGASRRIPAESLHRLIESQMVLESQMERTSGDAA